MDLFEPEIAPLQGGPAKVRPTYILLVTFGILECIDKIQWFFGKCDNCLTIHIPWEA